MALKAACLQVWPFLFSEGDSPKGLMNRRRSHLVNQQHKDLQTKLILLTLEQPELHQGLQKHHWGSFRKSFCLVQHKQEDSSLFSCVVDTVLKSRSKKQCGKLQNTHKFVSHLQHDNRSFPSHLAQLPPAKLLLAAWPGASCCGQTG